MFRKLFIFIFTISIFTSCQECTECVSVQSINGIEIRTPYEQFCGDSEMLDSYEQMLQNNVPEFVTVECTRN